jgi:ubiquitin
MGSIGELSLGDIGRALGRYKPVVLTVLAILVALAVLPKPDRPPGLGATGLAGAGISTPAPAATARPAADGPADSDAGGDALASPVTSETSFGSFSASPSFDSDDTSSGSSDFPDGPSGGSSSDFGPITSGTSTADTTGEPQAPKSLRIVGTTWATRTAGTPLAKQDVPEGTLPVATRVTDSKRSYVRLAGDGTALSLTEEPTGRRDSSGPVKVQACKVTATWEDGEAVALQDAPPFDANKCVQGTASGDGGWLFDLSSFPDRADDKGFALVPGEGAGVEWQVAFKVA